MNDKINLRSILRDRISEKKITQKELSKMTGVTEAKISKYLNEKAELRTDTFERLFNCD